MSRRLLLASGSGDATGPDPEPDPGDGTVHVFSLNGQSNMWGQYGYDPLIDTSNPRILVWPGSGPSVGTIIEAVEPLPGRLTGASPPSGIGPGMSFAKALLPHLPSGDTILLVPNAVGATTLGGDWNPGGSDNLYTQAIDRTNAAITAAGSVAEFSGFLWLQGESDGGTSQASYAAMLDTLIAGMRAGVTGADDAPFLVLGMVPEYTGAPGPRAAHIDTPNRVANTAYVPGPSGMNVGDNLHYTGAGQRILGASTYTAYAALT